MNDKLITKNAFINLDITDEFVKKIEKIKDNRQGLITGDDFNDVVQAIYLILIHLKKTNNNREDRCIKKLKINI